MDREHKQGNARHRDEATQLRPARIGHGGGNPEGSCDRDQQPAGNDPADRADPDGQEDHGDQEGHRDPVQEPRPRPQHRLQGRFERPLGQGDGTGNSRGENQGQQQQIEAIEAVRPLKDGVIADVDITEMMLRHFLKQVTAKRIFRIKPRVVVGVPSGITELERRAVRSSAMSAGAKSVYMVAEPMAAAIGVGLPVETPTGNMVIDIGGGTTEIAVIALAGIVSNTSIRVGGDEFDAAIVTFLRKNYNLLIGEPTAEAIKIQIGSAFEIGEEREMDVKGRDLVSGIPKTVHVHSQEIRECIQEPIQAVVEAVRRALEITPPELASDIVDRGIVMTGGGALIRGMDRLLQHETNLPIHVDEEPLSCVVRGVGRILDDLQKYRTVLST
ncbi:MAG: rod shape-determining protein [Gemmatimonadetes bacterium]|nr:rod shape-determining protein [Gemmatimonadota bacterium]